MHAVFTNPGPKELEQLGGVVQAAIRSGQSCFILITPVPDGSTIATAFDCKIKFLGATQFLCPDTDAVQFNANHNGKQWMIDALSGIKGGHVMLVMKDPTSLKITGRVLVSLQPDNPLTINQHLHCRWVLDTSTKAWTFQARKQ